MVGKQVKSGALKAKIRSGVDRTKFKLLAHVTHRCAGPGQAPNRVTSAFNSLFLTVNSLHDERTAGRKSQQPLRTSAAREDVDRSLRPAAFLVLLTAATDTWVVAADFERHQLGFLKHSFAPELGVFRLLVRPAHDNGSRVGMKGRVIIGNIAQLSVMGKNIGRGRQLVLLIKINFVHLADDAFSYQAQAVQLPRLGFQLT